MKFLCWLGIHDWIKVGDIFFKCNMIELMCRENGITSREYDANFNNDGASKILVCHCCKKVYDIRPEWTEEINNNISKLKTSILTLKYHKEVEELIK